MKQPIHSFFLVFLILTLLVQAAAALNQSAGGGCVITATATQVCPGSTVTLSVVAPNPPGSVSWSNGDINTSITVVVNGTTQFFAYVIDEFGVPCTSSVVIEVSNIQVNMNSQNSGCAGSSIGSATANPTNGFQPYTYLWSTGETTQSVSGLAAGSFGVLVTDNAGCTATANGNILEFQPIQGPLQIAAQPSCAGSDGSAFIVPFGGSGSGYTFLWSNGETTNQVNNLDAGPITVTVTDGSGCTGFFEDTLDAANAIVAVFLSFQDPGCNGLSDGAIEVDSILGGLAPYQIGWSNGASGYTVSGLVADVYDVYIVDANNCSFLETITLTDPPPITASSALNDPFCYGASTGSVQINSVSGGTQPYSYLWTNGANSQNLNNIPAGNYGLTITDANGCQQSYLYTLQNPTPILIGAINGPGNVVEYSSGSYEVLLLSGVSYSWSITGGVVDSGSTSPTVYVTWNYAGTGMLYVSAYDSVSGCTLNDSLLVNITQPVGIRNAENGPILSVYPNPFVNQIAIRGITNDMLIQLFAGDGKLIAEQKGRSQLIGLDEVDAGIYFLKISTADGKQFVEKVLKIRN